MFSHFGNRNKITSAFQSSIGNGLEELAWRHLSDSAADGGENTQQEKKSLWRKFRSAFEGLKA